MMNNYIRTIDFGFVPIRKTYTEGNYQQSIELTERENDEACFAEIRTDYRTNQPFAVLFDENWNQLGKKE